MPEIWITGIGIVSPLGIGRENVLDALLERKSGIGPVTHFETGDFPVGLAAEVKDFRARDYVKNRKALKVSRLNIHLALAAGKLAWDDAGLEGRADPNRTGVVMSAGRITANLMEVCFPVRNSIDENGKLDLSEYARQAPDYMPPYWFLRHIPNLVPGHISIELGLKGPSNTNCMTVVGGLLALEEAARIIERDDADVMLAGGADTLVEPYHLITHLQKGRLDTRKEGVPCPFDTNARGTVLGDGSTVLVLENAATAKAQGKSPLAVLERFDYGKTVDVPFEGPPRLLRKPEGTPQAAVTALAGTGVRDFDALEIELAGESDTTCYRALSGWMAGSNGPHDLACLLIEAGTGEIRPCPQVQDPILGDGRWGGRKIGSGDVLGVQCLSWEGQFASLKVRLP